MIQNRRSPRSEPLPDSTQGRRHELVRLKAGLCLAERARPRAQQSPSGLTRWIFTDISVALDAAAPEDGRAPLNWCESGWCTLLVLAPWSTPSSSPLRQGLADFPMMSERVEDASQTPAILVADRPHDARSCRNSPVESCIGIGTIITIRTVPPPRDSGLKFKCSGDSSATQNSASPIDKRATTAPLSSSIRNDSPAPNAAL